MDQFEYLIPFMGIILALSATDLLVSVHRIITERQRIKFHIVPMIWASIAFLLVISGWTGIFQMNNNVEIINAGQLFLLSLLPMVVFLISALSLPHTIKTDLCMWDYYVYNRVPLFASHIAYLILIPLVLYVVGDIVNTQQMLRNAAFIIMFASLMWIKNWVWHLVVGLVFMSVAIISIFKQTM